MSVTANPLRLKRSQKEGLVRILHFARRRDPDVLPVWAGYREHLVDGSMALALERKGLVETRRAEKPYRRVMCRLTLDGWAEATKWEGNLEAEKEEG